MDVVYGTNKTTPNVARGIVHSCKHLVQIFEWSKIVLIVAPKCLFFRVLIRVPVAIQNAAFCVFNKKE